MESVLQHKCFTCNQMNQSQHYFWVCWVENGSLWGFLSWCCGRGFHLKWRFCWKHSAFAWKLSPHYSVCCMTNPSPSPAHLTSLPPSPPLSPPFPSFSPPDSAGFNPSVLMDTALSTSKPIEVKGPGGKATIIHAQYNTPISMYSQDSIMDAIAGQTQTKGHDAGYEHHLLLSLHLLLLLSSFYAYFISNSSSWHPHLPLLYPRAPSTLPPVFTLSVKTSKATTPPGYD